MSTARASTSGPEFCRWLRAARPGDWLEYHRGLLAWERGSESPLPQQKRRVLAGVADEALAAAHRGEVVLIQRRNADFDFSYFAVRTRPSRAARLPAAA